MRGFGRALARGIRGGGVLLTATAVTSGAQGFCGGASFYSGLVVIMAGKGVFE